MPTNDDITVLQVYKSDNEILKPINPSEGNVTYQIPRYQRPFAWGEEESYSPIDQLIDDINRITNETYYLGSLVVYKKNEDGRTIYEVIDGQQRLTTLYLLFAALGVKKENLPHLTYQQRPKADKALADIANGKANEQDQASQDEQDKDIRSGFSRIKNKLESLDKAAFKDKLKKVQLFRVEIEPYKPSDLNRYFEVMNTRGVQLEQVDIVKSTLMSKITDANGKKLFADIWYACSRMDGYVQRNMTQRARNVLFDCNGKIQENDFDTACGKLSDTDEFQPAHNATEDQFHSIINFPHFLLHVLKVCCKDKNLSMDDQKLSKTFEDKLKTQEDSKEFIMRLLKCRYLMDTYLVKREKTDKKKSECWSLKKYGETDKKADPKNTFDSENILMLQSCLRVSFTNPASMSWITNALTWLDKGNTDPTQFEIELEKNFAQNTELEHFVRGKKDTPSDGTCTPHIVFFYLDYLLWKEKYDEAYNKALDDAKQSIRKSGGRVTLKKMPQMEESARKSAQEKVDFQFQYRSSVEHFYPQHPKAGLPPADDNHLHHFGNLCLLTKGKNSQVSNASPSAKITDYGDSLCQQSMKFRYMQAAFEDQKKEDKNAQWIDSTYQTHGDEMFAKLCQGFNVAVSKQSKTDEKNLPQRVQEGGDNLE